MRFWKHTRTLAISSLHSTASLPNRLTANRLNPRTCSFTAKISSTAQCRTWKSSAKGYFSLPFPSHAHLWLVHKSSGYLPPTRLCAYVWVSDRVSENRPAATCESGHMCPATMDFSLNLTKIRIFFESCLRYFGCDSVRPWRSKEWGRSDCWRCEVVYQLALIAWF